MKFNAKYVSTAGDMNTDFLEVISGTPNHCSSVLNMNMYMCLQNHPLLIIYSTPSTVSNPFLH